MTAGKMAPFLSREFNSRYLHLWIAVSACLVLVLNLVLFLLLDQRWSGVRALGGGIFEQYPGAYRLLLGALALETLASVVCLFVLARVTSRRIGGAFARLGQAFRQVRDGDLNTRVTFEKHDCLEDVERSFNEMVDALRERKQSRKPRP